MTINATSNVKRQMIEWEKSICNSNYKDLRVLKYKELLKINQEETAITQ
jgi:hypothetical protein